MVEFNEETATADELWAYCIQEYESSNFIVRWMLKNFFAKIRQAIKLLDANDRVLEVGCGAGISSLQIFDMLDGQEFEVSDTDERYIQKLQEESGPIKATQESVYELKRKNNEFDCVILLEVLEHLEHYERALAELCRVSRKYLIISVPNEPLWSMLNLLRGKYIKSWGNTPGHTNHWSQRDLVRLLSRYGDVVQLYKPLPWLIAVTRVW